MHFFFLNFFVVAKMKNQITKKLILSKNEIENVAGHYARQYEVNDWLVNMEEIWEQHGHSHFHIYRKLCQIQNWLIDSDKNKVKAKIPRRKEHIF